MNATASWLGIDLGTSGVKASLIGPDQRILADAMAPLTVARRRADWAEQNPQSWIDAIVATIDAIAARQPRALAGLRGIGLAGHMHGATLLGADDEPLRDCILWNDGRSAEQCATLTQRADFVGITGNLVMPGFTAPKIEWVRDHEPQHFDRIARVLLPKDYVRLVLTGDHVSDMSDSAGTLWLDVARRCWSDELLAATGLQRTQMPHVIEGSAAGGVLRAEYCQRWGIEGRPVVAGGGGDNAASACGVGAVGANDGFLSLGTSGVLFVSNQHFSPNVANAVHAFCHAVPDTWHQMGVMLSATDSLNWLARITGQAVPALVSRVRAHADASRERIAFLPYLSGERTPHNAPHARAVFSGMSHSSTVDDLAQAVMEGVAYAFADCADALRAAGAQPGELTAIGGGARAGVWLQLIADATGIVLRLPADSQLGAAFGAARLAVCASEGARPAEVCTRPAIQQEVAPDARMQAYHAEGLVRHRQACRRAGL